MLDFAAYPTYSRYRTLEYLPGRLLVGFDVYALQTALAATGFDPGPFDGILGENTARAIRSAQKRYYLTVDGKAGGLTQRALILAIIEARAPKWVRAMKGQVEHESSNRVGNYSALHGSTYDAGATQRNTEHTPAKDGFNVPKSIDALKTRIVSYHEKFAGVPEPRRTGLAQGAWNAPAFACYLAKREGATGVTRADLPGYTPSAATLSTFEQYIDSVTTYL